MKIATCLGLIILGTLVCYSFADVSFQFDVSKPTTAFPHFWEQCVGSGHALLALRADYQKYLTRVRKELGFTHVRFHGILDDDMSTYTTINGAPSTSFFNIDQIFDFLLSINMKPYLEISFMPELLASGNTTVFHYEGNTTPPTSYSAWNQLVTSVITHLIERYGIDEVRTWPMEVWNEPNCGFWTGTQQDYFTLYQNTATTIKAIDPLLIVGGPATCQSQWIPEFLSFTSSNNVPVDFVSTHEYPTDVTPPLLSLESIVATARQQAGNLPLYYSEYNDGLYYDPSYHDTSYAAAFIAKNVHDVQGYVDIWSWWTFSDIFEEQGFSAIPFYDPNGWGLLNRYGIPKPSYRAFQLLHSLGTDQVVSSSSDPSSSLGSYGIVQTTEANRQRLTIVAYNIYIPTETNSTSVVGQFQVTGFPAGATLPSSASLYLIDQDHCNPAQAWVNMGSPAYLNAAQLNLLEIASEVPVVPLPLTVSSNSASFTVNMLPQALAFITIDF